MYRRLLLAVILGAALGIGSTLLALPGPPIAESFQAGTAYVQRPVAATVPVAGAPWQPLAFALAVGLVAAVAAYATAARRFR